MITNRASYRSLDQLCTISLRDSCHWSCYLCLLRTAVLNTETRCYYRFWTWSDIFQTKTMDLIIHFLTSCTVTYPSTKWVQNHSHSDLLVFYNLFELVFHKCKWICEVQGSGESAHYFQWDTYRFMYWSSKHPQYLFPSKIFGIWTQSNIWKASLFCFVLVPSPLGL